ncbi:hypothetical protein LRS10_21855 [Phenylobacterium sp. J426]|uniref:hypothetical protein n=1 Tax=Phenylobacterium sp. J426 TaxID=2898439 RepID=UPI002151CCD3|nr:hypothetical protein [Phenylobacterium sp. J426]MCR5876556.1 hypothetical protein [Phenylobacterium sp. J426]
MSGMQSAWRPDPFEFGWRIVCDAPLGLRIDFGIMDEGVLVTPFFSEWRQAHDYAHRLNAADNGEAKRAYR